MNWTLRTISCTFSCAFTCAFTCAAFLCAPCLGQAPAPAKGEVISKVARSADERLAKGIIELNALREQVTNEKLPLSQQLTGLEEQVTGLRKESDRVSRLIDAGALDIASIKQELKARQDELSYVGNLRVTQVVNGNKGIHLMVDKTYFRGKSLRQA